MEVWKKTSSELDAAVEVDGRLKLAPYVTRRRLKLLLHTLRFGIEKGRSGETGAIYYKMVSLGDRLEGRGLSKNYGESIVDLSALKKNLVDLTSEGVINAERYWVRFDLDGVHSTCFRNGILIASAIGFRNAGVQVLRVLEIFGRAIEPSRS
jgi:hypothetical protein